MTQLSANQLTKLGNIVAATQNPDTGYVHMSEKSVKVLLDAGMVECNTEMTDAQGNPAVRATPEGIETMNTTPDNAASEATAAAPQTEFVIEDVPLPNITRGGTSASKYPFDTLEIGQSFFVPATEDMPNPGKSLASTVSSASKRYATKNGTRTINRKADEALAAERGVEVGAMVEVEVDAYDYARKFKVRTIKDDAGNITGARVGRVEPDEGDDNE